MYNSKIYKIIKSKHLYKKINIYNNFCKIKKKNNLIFNSFKNNEKKILTNLCFH